MALDIPALLEDRKAALKAAGIPIYLVLKRANVNGTTWSLWKNGTVRPRLDTWMRVEEELTKALRAPDLYRLTNPRRKTAA
jgi:hypothetical protein